MEENEYKDNEKVLYKTKGKLLSKEPEEADLFVTEGIELIIAIVILVCGIAYIVSETIISKLEAMSAVTKIFLKR
ncbi:MAG TPA: hypothetical protein G4O06_01470 [Dehalococcoidia bacterium]|jgi:hypothetical protein|nr:hypothetical protein [Dehalococcoidia bacterium]